MVFSRLFFIYLFFPICFLCYFATKKTSYRNAVLIVFSLLFYACGDLSFLWLVVASALVNFVLGRGIERFRDKTPAKLLLALGLVLNLGTLVGFKYTGFFIENLNHWFSLSIPVPDLPLPLGISFFTFRTVSYLIDCAWGKVKSERNFFTFLLYVSFFPITISGPIARYETMQADLHQRRISADDISIGFGRIAVGLAKKIMLADRLSGIVDQFLGNDFTSQTTLGVWYGVVLYALQMYFDFSGYSDMAIGIARIFGFHLDENFRHPFLCKDITEFWQRWHISLGTFFRDYLLYVPLFGKRRKIGGLLLVWFCTGLWHGASWNFVLWGLIFFVLLTLEKNVYGKFLERTHILKHAYIIFIIPLTWMVFAITDMHQLGTYFTRLFPFLTSDEVQSNTRDAVQAFHNYWKILVPCVLFSTPLPLMYYKKFRKSGFCMLLLLILFVLAIRAMMTQTNNPFLYFQF